MSHINAPGTSPNESLSHPRPEEAYLTAPVPQWLGRLITLPNVVVTNFRTPEVVGYYGGIPELFNHFSYHQVAVTLDGQSYEAPTVECAYQASKFDGTSLETASAVLQAGSSYRAKKIARECAHLVRQDWETVKVDVMFGLDRLKVEGHKDVYNGLMATEGALILEYAEGDSTWGCGKDGNGHNLAGKIFMALRDGEIQGTDPRQLLAEYIPQPLTYFLPNP